MITRRLAGIAGVCVIEHAHTAEVPEGGSPEWRQTATLSYQWFLAYYLLLPVSARGYIVGSAVGCVRRDACFSGKGEPCRLYVCARVDHLFNERCRNVW